MMPLQRIYFRVESRDMLCAVVIGEQSEAKLLQHRRPLLRTTFAPVKWHDAPRHQVAPGKQIIARPRLRLTGIYLRPWTSPESHTAQRLTQKGPAPKPMGW